MRQVYVLCLLLTLATACVAQRKNSVILPETQAKPVTRQCSRADPEYTGTWMPMSDDIKTMESHFSDLAKLIDKKWKQPEKVPVVETSNMQYVGLIINGKKFIYINAFPMSSWLEKRWETTAVRVCDGGAVFWGALYDVSTGVFSEVAFNGYA
jgi:hypothetical protein